MFSLRTTILLALSTGFFIHAVSGYTLVVPIKYDNPFPEANQETTTNLPTPVPETTTVPTFQIDEPISVTTMPPPVVKQNLTIYGSPHRKGTAACLCKECNTEDGCVIKHYRQYNYYYPNGQKVTVPIDKPAPITTDELSANSVPVASSIRMTNNNGRVTVQTLSRPTMSYNLPGVVSYIPNNGNNYVYNQAAMSLQQSTPLLNNAPIFNTIPIISNKNVEVDTPAEDKSEPSVPVDEPPATPSPTDDNLQNDIINYLTDPNVFGQTRMTFVRHGNNPNFQSQQVSMSSMVQPQPPLSVPGFQSNIDWLGGASASTSLYKPNIQYINPVTTWQNMPSPYRNLQLPNLPPVYSVVV